MKKIKIYLQTLLFLILVLNVTLITYDHKHTINLLPLMGINSFAIIGYFYWDWVSVIMEKELVSILYEYTYKGIQYFIYDRQPQIGELCCTWYPEKEKKLRRHKISGLSVFIFDEQALQNNFDYKFVKIKTT